MNLFETLKTKTLPFEYSMMSDEEMKRRIRIIKQKLGAQLYILGHHYQKDEVYKFADAVGDSLQLSQMAAANKKAAYIVFCGVHFMAETADILTTSSQRVVLPDMRAGCSMADMANIEQTEKAWPILQSLFGDTIIPLTYVNSTAEIKAFVGKHHGATVTSSNAKEVVQWAFSKKQRILFLPDQHLGRNTAYELGVPLSEMAIWDPIENELVFDGDIEDVKIILWKGHCSVHENFTLKNIEHVRKAHPNMNIIVHPECTHDVVQHSDYAGSTKYIMETIEQAPSGSEWAIGTEMNLVNRLIHAHDDKKVISLNPYMCPCLTMNRIDLPHLLWSLEMIDKGTPINEIKVESEVAELAQKALNNMLAMV
ncbi:quinolinate synthase NadA [Priestia flexa]|uniref:quinolinate synthase NadA n=1 Tax=Priestia TaxID=2800373 RepID=UPI0010FBD0C8|nr:quinolinate synthase NadA [Priestia flexa]MED3822585.1 quinolinate synthase NadA [Priestia flexa]QCS51830.1 quinolinate synthase NadA [Priestia flexa]WHX78541.1 quinolinate synthase NadA [Priestia flexa]